MEAQQTITFFATVSNSASSRGTKNGCKYTAFKVSIISDRLGKSSLVSPWASRGALRQPSPA